MLWALSGRHICTSGVSINGKSFPACFPHPRAFSEYRKPCVWETQTMESAGIHIISTSMQNFTADWQGDKLSHYCENLHPRISPGALSLLFFDFLQMLCKLGGEAPTLSVCLFYTSSAGILSSYGRLQELQVRHRHENNPVADPVADPAYSNSMSSKNCKQDQTVGEGKMLS